MFLLNDKSLLKYKMLSQHLYLEDESSNEIMNKDKFESSEPCWDGYQVNHFELLRLFVLLIFYQNPLFYPLNPQEIESMETIIKWDDQFFEVDQIYNTTSDDDMHAAQDNFSRPSIRVKYNNQLIKLRF